MIVEVHIRKKVRIFHTRIPLHQKQINQPEYRELHRNLQLLRINPQPIDWLYNIT